MIRNAALHNTALHDDTRLHTLHKTIHKTIVHFLSSLTRTKEQRQSARRLTKQGEARERSGWMDGVRGLETISGQKLGGFRALWLPLFARQTD